MARGRWSIHPGTLKAITVEAHMALEGLGCDPGCDPTVLAVPAGPKWESPYVAWRLGFFESSARPEFQVTLQGASMFSVARARMPAPIGPAFHLAGTFDGECIRLYVDGDEVAATPASGSVLASTQPHIIGARNALDNGGYLIGSIRAVRVWKTARSPFELLQHAYTNLEWVPEDCIMAMDSTNVNLSDGTRIRPARSQ
jgi:hypothetical protein